MRDDGAGEEKNAWNGPLCGFHFRKRSLKY